MKSLLLTTAFCLLASTATASTMTLESLEGNTSTVASPHVSAEIVMAAKSGTTIHCTKCKIIIKN